MSTPALDAMIAREGFAPDSLGRQWIMEAFAIGLDEAAKTLRDEFAGKALQGILSGVVAANAIAVGNAIDCKPGEAIAATAYMYADVMLHIRAIGSGQ
jgi:hypothetical protein